MIEVKDLNGEYNKGFSIWHCNCEFELKNFRIRCSDGLGGCGVSHLYEWLDNENHDINIIEEVLLYVEKYLLSLDVGCIFCQVGQPFYKSNLVKVLEKLDYTYIEYKNPRHNNDLQRMYYKEIV